MKTMLGTRWNTLLILAVILSFGAIGLVDSQESIAATKKTRSFRVGVIDPQAVIENSKAGSRALATLKEHAQARESLLKNDQKELEKLQNDLKAKQSSLSKEELKEKQEQFGRKLQSFQKRGQEFQVELNQKQKELVQEYMKKIQTATSIVAKRHGFDVVIDKGSETTLKIVLYSRDGLDLTREVTKEFDRRYK